jgi:hypothetical protein
MQSPRIGVVFCLGQCDQENHGWREGPPLTDSLQGCDLWRAFTLPINQLERKKEYCRLPPSANAFILGIGRFTAVSRPRARFSLGTELMYQLLQLCDCGLSGMRN